jgi:DNA-3-methyladenine glycosylase I
MNDYHDREWGVPLHQDRKLFEFLILEGFQAGLSWEIILNKRENFREAFDGFDYGKIARYGKGKLQELMSTAGIVRNRLKIEAAVTNARVFVGIREEYGSFDEYLWPIIGGRPIINAWRDMGEIPPSTPESEILSRDLKRRGFRFVGPTICYAFMQAVGMVNDHVVSCFRYRELGG